MDASRTPPKSLMVCAGDIGKPLIQAAHDIAGICRDRGATTGNRVTAVGFNDFNSNHIGHSALQAVRLLKDAKGGVLLVQDLPSLMTHKFGPEILNTLLNESRKSQNVVIFGGETAEMAAFCKANPGLASLLGPMIDVDNVGNNLRRRVEDRLSPSPESRTSEELLRGATDSRRRSHPSPNS